MGHSLSPRDTVCSHAWRKKIAEEQPHEDFLDEVQKWGRAFPAGEPPRQRLRGSDKGRVHPAQVAAARFPRRVKS